MSTIEEAREQARETLADYHRVNAGGYGAGNHTYLARALRALLDATEPPAYAEFHDHQTMDKVRDALLISGYRDVAGAIHHMQNAGILFRERKQVQAVEPAEDEREALALNLDDLDALEAVATKHPYISAIHAPTVLTLIAKLREAEAVIEKVREIVEPPKPLELGKSMMRSFDRMIGDLRRALAIYKPTNQPAPADVDGRDHA